MNIESSEILLAAKKWIGTPYRHQASKMGVGCDCLGLVRGVWGNIYDLNAPAIPPYAQFGKDPIGALQLLDAAKFYLEPVQKNPLPGLVILFQLHQKLPPRHCGIVSLNNRFIHAKERQGVIQTDLCSGWHKRIHSIYTFPKKV